MCIFTIHLNTKEQLFLDIYSRVSLIVIRPPIPPSVVNVPDKPTITVLIAGLMQYITDKVDTVEGKLTVHVSILSLKLTLAVEVTFK